MRLAEIKEGAVVRCSSCSCGRTEEGFVEGKIYLEDIYGCPNGCLDAFHTNGSQTFAFAMQFCPVCKEGSQRKRWAWCVEVNHKKIKIIKELVDGK